MSLTVDGPDLYLGRTDGTVARRSLDLAFAGATPRVASLPGMCPREGGEWGLLGSFGETEQRGRLDDTLPWDEPAPSFNGEPMGRQPGVPPPVFVLATTHTAALGGPGVHQWDLDFEPMWIDSASGWSLDVLAGNVESDDQFLPTEDPERLAALIAREGARRDAANDAP